jgi:LmbE family N-acetylglucosaminyl deacetylase
VPRLVSAEPELISDGGGLPFPPAALSDQTQSLDVDDPAVAALVAQLAGERPRLRLPWSRKSPEPDPQTANQEAAAALSSWRQLARTEDEALFGRGRPPHLLTVSIVRDPRRDRWRVTAISRGKGLRAACASARASSWRVDPNFEPVATDTELRILVTEQRRSGGKRAEGRLLEPELYIGEQELILTMFVSPLPVVAIQGANPETPVRIQLPEPVGERAVLDGALYEPPTG